jgi:hypothetical protein
MIYATAYERTVRPTFVVDITKEYARRRRAILAYGSQFRPKKRERGRVHIPLDELEERMQLMTRYYGQMVGVQYAEPFLVREVMEVDDVVSLPVRSI